MRSVMPIALLSAIAAAPSASGQAPAPPAPTPAPAPPAFKGTASLPDSVEMVAGFSGDRQAVTVIFQDLVVGLGGLKGEPHVKTLTTTVDLGVLRPDGETPLTFDVRGFVSVDARARAALVVQAAGKTTVVDLKAGGNARSGTAQAEPCVIEARENAKARAKDLPRVEPPSQSTDFVERIQGSLPAGVPCRVTFFLLVERDADDAQVGGLLAVDTVDVAVLHAVPVKK